MVEETIQPVAELPVERAMRPATQLQQFTAAGQLKTVTDDSTGTAQFGQIDSTSTVMTTTSRLQQTTTMTSSATATATAAGTTVHTPLGMSVMPIEPMPDAIPGIPSPYHAVDFCVPVGPDFNLVDGTCMQPADWAAWFTQSLRKL